MKLILTNDDGFDAPGIAALAEALSDIGQIVIVAPDVEQSGVGHQVTAHTPIRFRKVDEGRYRICGTPADCARIGIRRVAPDADWLISGINKGANLGVDVYTSGTVAAAREAAVLGCASMAVSQYVAKGGEVDWAVTGAHAGRIIREFIWRRGRKGFFYNINLPHPLTADRTPETRRCRIDLNPHDFIYERRDGELIYRADFHGRPRTPGRDVALCFGGFATVSRMGLDMTLAVK